MSTIRNLSTLSLAALGTLVACAGANQVTPISGTTPENPPSLTSAQNVDQSIVERLAAARCDQEQKCNNIGDGDKYASRDVCMNQQRGSMANDLNAYQCPHGIDRDGLNRCMAAITSEECSRPLDTLMRYDKCRSGALCIK